MPRPRRRRKEARAHDISDPTDADLCRAPDDRDAYIVTKPIVRPYNDPDEGVSVKNTGEIQPEGYSYVFVEPGTYKAVFVGEITTLYGQEKVTKEFEITVTE